MFDCMRLSVSVYECVGGCMLYDACVHVGVCKVCVCVYVSVHQCVSVCIRLCVSRQRVGRRRRTGPSVLSRKMHTGHTDSYG